MFKLVAKDLVRYLSRQILKKSKEEQTIRVILLKDETLQSNVPIIKRKLIQYHFQDKYQQTLDVVPTARRWNNKRPSEAFIPETYL